MEKIVFTGYVEEIKDDIACCLMKIRGEGGIKYTAEIPVVDFDDVVEVGICFTFMEGDKSLSVLKLPPLTQEDIDNAQKWAEKISKKLKWI